MIAPYDSLAVRDGGIVDDLNPQFIGDTTIGAGCSLKIAELSERVVGQDLSPDGFKVGEALSIVRHHPFYVDMDRFDPYLVSKSEEWNRL